jgi:hypothetical protein
VIHQSLSNVIDQILHGVTSFAAVENKGDETKLYLEAISKNGFWFNE